MLLFRLGTSGSMAISVKSPPLPLVGKLVVFVKNKEDKVYFKWHSRNLPNNFFPFFFLPPFKHFLKNILYFLSQTNSFETLDILSPPFFFFSYYVDFRVGCAHRYEICLNIKQENLAWKDQEKNQMFFRFLWTLQTLSFYGRCCRPSSSPFVHSPKWIGPEWLAPISKFHSSCLIRFVFFSE